MFPKGAKEYYSNSMRDWVSIDHQVEHVTGLAGEVSCGRALTKMSLFGRHSTKVFAHADTEENTFLRRRGEYAIFMRLLTATLLWTLHE